MIDLFVSGGPIMWPLLLASIVAVATVIERLWFVAASAARRDEGAVDKILSRVERGEVSAALEAGKNSGDYVAKVLIYGLQNGENGLSSALLRAANWELRRFNRGLAILDTIITLAPLLGLLGTVTGMISAFGLLGGAELGAPTAITGGIAEALIATAFGLGIAITSLIPFNYLNARLEAARQEIEDAATQLELLLLHRGHRTTAPLLGAAI